MVVPNHKKIHSYKIISPTSIALKKMRNVKGVSLRKLSILSGIPESTISHSENGRKDYISEEYIAKISLSLGYTDKDWENFFAGKFTDIDLQNEYIKLIRDLKKDKLKTISELLRNF